MGTTIIRGGRLVTAAGEADADLLIDGEQVAAIGRPGSLSADEEIDARGRYVLPGGVDPHVHFQTPAGGAVTCDDFTTGTAAAAFGGTTTALHFCMQAPDESPAAALDGWFRQLEESPPVVDVGFHMLVTALRSPHDLEELAAMPARGVSSVKLFMAGEPALPGSGLFAAMRVAARSGSLVMIHCEDGEAIQLLIDEALSEGRREPRWHAATRPPASEAAAVARAIELTRLAGGRLYVVHVSSADALAPIVHARAAGVPVVGETCPQYLVLDDSVYEGDEADALKYVFTPPPRDRRHQQPLWEALASDQLSVVGSDHCPFLIDDKLGKRDFTQVPNGTAGIETRLPLLFDRGVRSGRLSLPRMVATLAEMPARVFGLYPRKGTLAPGSDADVVLFDPNGATTISATTHHSATDHSVYEGWQLQGSVDTVLVRGRTVVDDGSLVVEPGHGRFLPRPAQPIAGAN